MCTRMPFGLSSAPEVFQNCLSTLLENFKNVEVSMDDILIHAKTEKELVKITKEFLDVIKRSGLKLNKEKCLFNRSSVYFTGHIVSENGIQADPKKVEAIQKANPPKNKKELQTLLGMVNYLAT